MNRVLIGLVGTLLVAQAWSVPAQPSSPAVSTVDRAFIRAVAGDNMIDIELGQLGAEKAASATVKQFGRRVVAERTAIQEALKKIAEDKRVAVPVARDPRRLVQIERLAKLSGADFDRAYMQAILREHARTVKEVQRQGDRLRDQDVKAWALRALPDLQEGLRQAQDIASAVGAARADATTSEIGS